jgi:hypothetical protein
MKTYAKLISLALLWSILCALPVRGQTQEAPVDANRSMMLAWDMPDPIETVIKWHVQVWTDPPVPSGIQPVMVANATTAVNGIELLDLFKDVENGRYFVQVIAEDFWGLQSEPSAPFYVFWYARPNPPGGLVVRIK